MRVYVLSYGKFYKFCVPLQVLSSHFAFMINKMRETEIIREKELGRPFSCVSSKPKYNADYLEKVIKTKWLKKLEELESENAYKNGLQRIA